MDVEVLGGRFRQREFGGLGWEGDPFEAHELEAVRGWLSSKAVSIYGGSAEIQNNKGTAFSSLAEVKKEVGEPDEALEDFRRALKCYDSAIQIAPSGAMAI